VCQNETLADSNAPLAKDLRKKIALQITAGASDKEILNYLINRYGDFILYKPRLMSATYLLWFSPVGLLLLGIFAWWRISRATQISQKLDFTQQEQQRLKELLDKTEEIS
jgi:cytochrome c-type biogenesis protein CcmH